MQLLEVLESLIDSEVDFCTNLTHLLTVEECVYFCTEVGQGYIKPLTDHNILSLESSKVMFSAAEKILALSTVFSSSLESRLDRYPHMYWKQVLCAEEINQTVSQASKKSYGIQLPIMMDSYETYILNYTAAITELQKNMEKPAFSTFILVVISF